MKTFLSSALVASMAVFSAVAQTEAERNLDAYPPADGDIPRHVLMPPETLTEEETDSLAKAAVDFVDAFNGRDAPALAALFTPQGEIVDSEGEIISGRQAIKDHYKISFDEGAAALMALEAHEVHLVAPGVAMESGLFHLTSGDDEPVRSFRYVVTHAKLPDGSWRIASSRILPEVMIPSEQIKPLHWLIGEWTLEAGQGVRMDMVMDLDERENYLIGESLITDTQR